MVPVSVGAPFCAFFPSALFLRASLLASPLLFPFAPDFFRTFFASSFFFLLHPSSFLLLSRTLLVYSLSRLCLSPRPFLDPLRLSSFSPFPSLLSRFLSSPPRFTSCLYSPRCNTHQLLRDQTTYPFSTSNAEDPLLVYQKNFR